jgi:hypothetical protein
MVMPPVMPRPNQLPLNDPNWLWDRFEAFCLDLISQFAEVKDCHRYGKQGDFQRGIDIFADLDNGERWAFQCKRYKRYTAGQTQKAIEKATYRANQYILLLSCEATSEVRDEVDKHPKWKVWDVEDISLKVRNLPSDIARRLVQDHFSAAWRKAFLGLAGLTTFVSSADFFRPVLNPRNRFNHTWSLVGRTELTEKLHEFVESKEQRLFILTGRGGIGKTKLLHAFSEEFDNRHQNVVLRFSAAPITPESLDELPIEPCVVVVDDANQQEGLEFLLAFARQNSQRIKLVLSCRPQGIDQLRSVFDKARFDCGEVKPSIELENLKLKEVKQLARQVLGKEYAYFAEKLAAVTRDCPLFTVIGGRLLAEKQVDPQLLERDKDFQDYLLTKFRDVLIGQVSNEIEPDLCKRLLELIAAVAPIRLTNDKFKQVAAEFLKIEPSKFVSSRSILEQSGILLRRGYTLRITPDILSDHILYKRCLTTQGEPTGYVQEIFEKFKAICPTQVLRNLAELDWRISYVSSEGTGLLADIWRSVWEEFRVASHSGRCYLLDLLKEVAYYQPEEMLKLVEFAMRNPATTPEDERLAKNYDHTSVLSRLPELLQSISYTMVYLPYCCDLLWKLGRDDKRELNRCPEPAMRVLTDLAKYDLGKPFAFNQEILEAVTRWQKKPDAHTQAHKHLDILDPLLKKSIDSIYLEDNRTFRRQFPLTREEIHLIRERALNLISDYLTSSQPKVILRALESLGKALQEPVDSSGKKLNELCEHWVPEQLKILEFIEALVTQNKESVVHLKVIEVLDRYAHCAYNPGVRKKAKNIIVSIPNTYELQLTRVLLHKHDWDWDKEDFRVSCQRYAQFVQETRCAVAEEVLQKYPDAAVGVQALNERLKEIEDSGFQPAPSLLLEALSEISPSYAAAMCEAIIEEPSRMLSSELDSLLSSVRAADINRAIAITRRAIDTGDSALCSAIAQIYYWRGWTKSQQPDDLEFIKKLLTHTDLKVRRLAISSFGVLGQLQSQLAISLALTVDISDSAELARELFQVFNPRRDIPPSVLTDEALDTLLTKLELVKRLDGCPDYIGEFLAYASRRRPRSVVQLLLNRIERSATAYNTEYEPLPHGEGFENRLNGLAKSEEYEDLLRTIRDRTLKKQHHERSCLARLFKEASLQFTNVSLKVLEEWINSGDSEKIQVVSFLLSEAPQEFFFTNVEFISNLLEQAYDLEDDCYQMVSSVLYSSATFRVGFGIPGQPFPHDVALRDKSAAIAAQLVVGSPSHRFYESLAQGAKASVQFWQKRWEEEFD